MQKLVDDELVREAALKDSQNDRTHQQTFLPWSMEMWRIREADNAIADPALHEAKPPAPTALGPVPQEQLSSPCILKGILFMSLAGLSLEQMVTLSRNAGRTYTDQI